MGKRIVIALGGNALGNNLPEQMTAVRQTAKAIADLIQEGHEVILSHGNGPQVGMIQKAMQELTRSDPEKYIPCPLSVCVAMSQGYIGYDLQNALREELLDRDIQKGVATVLTQVEVDRSDPAFQNPTKPIGAFMTKEEADRMVAERGYTVMEDAGRGYRRVVASPKPKSIVEIQSIRDMAAAGLVVVACGGGGIPVYATQGHHLKGAPGRHPDHPHRRGKGGDQLRQARSEMAGYAHPGRGRGLYGPGPLRPRLHAAQGPGGGRVRPFRPRPLRAHYPAGKGEGRRGRQDRHRDPAVIQTMVLPFGRPAKRENHRSTPAVSPPFRGGLIFYTGKC